jgi:hypothetical protein
MKKIHLATGNDSLRPSIGYIKITKEFSYATDCHIAVKIPTAEILGKLNVETEFYINGKEWAKFKFYNAENFGMYENQLTAYDKKGNRLGIIDVIKQENFQTKTGYKYPDVNGILPNESNKKAIENIGINAELYSKVTQAMGAESCKMTFFAENRGVMLKPVPAQYSQNNSIGIIMPIMITNY